MAVHMINRQPQTSWWEALADKVVIPMIGNAIERQRQRDENKKNNALIAQTMNDILAQGQPQMGQSAGGGNGGNGWENASHASGISSLPQFDAGTADLLPPSMQGMPQQTPQKNISANDFWKAMAANLGTDRFGMVDPKVAQELAVPYINAMEAARTESMRNAAVDKIWEAQDARGRRDATYEHVLRGNIPENLGKMMNDVYVQDRPQPMMYDMGGNYQGIMYDPVTGTFTNAQKWDKSLTPQQADTAAYNRAVLGETIRSNQANEALKRQELEYTNRPKLSSTTVLSDGRRIGILTDGTEVELTPDTAGFTAIEKQQLDTLNTRRASLLTQRTELLKVLAKAQTDEERASIQNSISSIDLQIKGVDNSIDNMYADKLNPPSWRKPKVPLGSTTNVALNMLGGRGTISSPFNAPRKKKDGTPYNHMGIDIAVEGGTEILVPDGGGAPFTVTRIANDPNGYGNYADLETNYKGHKIEFRIGHMADGSLTVKKGDTLYTGNIIGLVGNTGNSRGKNGGYHMHLEIKVDGKHINPKEYNKFIGSLAQTETQGNNAQLAPQGTPQNAPAANNAQPVDNTPASQNGQPNTNGGFLAHLDNIAANPLGAFTDFLGITGDTLPVNQATPNAQVAQQNPQPSTQQEAQATMQEIAAQNNGNPMMGLLPLAPTTTSPLPPALPAPNAIPQPAHATNWNLPVPATNGANPPATIPAETPISAGAALWPNPVPVNLIANSHQHLGQEEMNRTRAAMQAQGVPDNVIDEVLGTQLAQVDAVSGAAPTGQANTANNTQLIPPLSGDIAAPQSTAQDFADVLHEAEQGMPQYDLSNTEFTASLPGSGVVPRAATRIDPDGGLTQYRAEGDDSPVTWRNTSGRPMRTSDGQLFTQKIYDDWRQKADAGYFRDRGINNAEDLNKWLNNVGMRPDRPSEQRGVNNLNGNSQANANLPPETEDTNITPFNITPSNSPEQFQAPQFTDEINDTTPDATQGLLDGLNGIVDRRYQQWTDALKQYPLVAPSPQINVPNSAPSWANRYGQPQTNPFAGAGKDYRIIRQDGDFLPPANQQGNNDMYKRRAEILRRYPSAPEPTPETTRFPSYTPTRTTQSAPKQAAPKQQTPVQAAPQKQVPQRQAPKPRGGYTNYEQQRTHVDGAAKRHGVDSALVRAIIQTESSWRPNARSGVGAMGLMQLMPKTAKWLGVKNAYDPAQNIEGGTKYIAQLIRQFGGDVSKALMAYNCGPGNVKKGRIPAESRKYAQQVMARYRRLKGQ